MLVYSAFQHLAIPYFKINIKSFNMDFAIQAYIKGILMKVLKNNNKKCL